MMERKRGTGLDIREGPGVEQRDSDLRRRCF